MAKSRSHGRQRHRLPKSSWPGGATRQLVDRVGWLHSSFCAGVGNHYRIEVTRRDLLNGRLDLKLPVAIPIYGERCLLRFEISTFSGSVFVDGFPGRLHHTYGNNRLCMWYPSDPPERRWFPKDGLLVLIDTALLHLFRERYFLDHPDEDWPGEEVPHRPNELKTDESMSSGPAAAPRNWSRTRLQKVA